MDEYSFPRHDDFTPPLEFPQPGPEFTPVGLRAAKDAAAEKRKKRKRIIYAIAAAALVLTSVGPFRLFSGSGSAAPSAPGTQQTQPGTQQTGSGTAKPGSLWPTLPGKQAAPPELTASFTGETGGLEWFWLDYNADFVPAADDETNYDLEVYRFGIYCYDTFGTFLEGTYVSASGIPDIEETEQGFHFHFDGPSNGEFPEGTKLIAIWMQVRDKNSGEIYEVVTESAEPPEEPVFIVPDCEIYFTSFYSEFRGVILFHDMDNATGVTMEYWNPDTDTLELSEDITDVALAEGEYQIQPFYTDFVYENHEEYYKERNEFPFSLELRVFIEYEGPGGYELASFSAMSAEEVGWNAGYVHADQESWTPWVTPGCFQVQSKDSEVEYEIIYGSDMPVSENYIFVTMEIDGEPVSIDPSQLDRLHDEYDASVLTNGEWSDHHFHTTMLVIPRPEGYAENEGHVATFTVRQYLAGAQTAVAFKEDVEF